VIAASFNSGELPYKKVDVRRSHGGAEPDQVPEPARNGQGRTPGWPLPSSGIGRAPLGLDDELDVPDFLKN
jgi:cell division protein FtsZ